jgi:extradiol dioxygenase family protein
MCRISGSDGREQQMMRPWHRFQRSLYKHEKEATLPRNLNVRADFVATLLPAFCLLTIGLPAQTGSSYGSPPMNGIAHVAIRVQDLNSSRAFYQKLGYEEAFALDNGGAPTEAFFKVNDRQFIELYPKRKPDEQIGFMHVCFESGNLEELNKYYLAHGLNPTPVKRAGAGNLLFTMQGPEQQNIEFTQYMPGSRHTLDIGKHLGASRVSDRIVGVGIQMQDVSKAREFYAAQMGFAQTTQQDHPDIFQIPGPSEQDIELLHKSPDNRLELMMGAKDLKQVAELLRQQGISSEARKSELLLHDPDGNIIELKLVPKVHTAAK